MTREGPPGPAPDGPIRTFETVGTDLVPADATDDRSLRARFQPWVDNGGIFVARVVRAETGHLGTVAFPADAAWPDLPPVADAEAFVWLSERGYPVGDGRYRGWVALAGDAAETLREGVRGGRRCLQSPSAGLAALSGVGRSQPADTAERAGNSRTQRRTTPPPSATATRSA